MKDPSDSGVALARCAMRRMFFCWIAVSVICANGLSAGSIFDDDWKEPAPAPKPSAPLELPAPPQQSSPAAPQPKPAEPQPQPLPAAAPAASPDRRPVPPREDQARSRKLLKEVFATQLADRTPAGRLALAEKLLDEARNTQDIPSDHFVLLIGVIAAGRDAGDLVICSQAADLLASQFSVDGFRVKVDTALKMSLKASPPAVALDNARDGLKLIDSLIVTGDYATAARMVGVVRPAAASDHLMAQRVAARGAEIEVIRSASEACVEEVRKLSVAPGDPAANLEVGRFLCFVQRRWQSGLPLLARGSDPELKPLAQRELAKPGDSKAVMQLADDWWTLGQRLTGLVQANIGEHAAALYHSVIDGLAGLERMNIDNRIQEIADRIGLVRGIPTYLTSLKEIDVQCLDPNWNASLWKTPIKVNGVEGRHGMYLHPDSDSSSHVTYNLAGRGIIFKTRLGLGDDVGSCWTPLTFKVIGDDKVLWQSKKVHERADAQACRIPILGVHHLTLMVDCPGRYEYAHAVWLDPQVLLE